MSCFDPLGKKAQFYIFITKPLLFYCFYLNEELCVRVYAIFMDRKDLFFIMVITFPGNVGGTGAFLKNKMKQSKRIKTEMIVVNILKSRTEKLNKLAPKKLR